MSDAYLLDTNAIIAIMNENQTVISFVNNITAYLPIIAIGEVYFGAEKSIKKAENIQKIEHIKQRHPVLMCDNTTARIYGTVSAGLSLKGRPIQHNDIWIAALALQYDLTVLTQDKGFEYIDTLKRKTW